MTTSCHMSKSWTHLKKLLWADLCTFTHSLSPGTSGCKCVERQGIQRYNSVKVRSLGWVLISTTGILTSGKDSDVQVENPLKYRGRATIKKPKEKPQETKYDDRIILTSRRSRTVRKTFLLFKPPYLWYFALADSLWMHRHWCESYLLSVALLEIVNHQLFSKFHLSIWKYSWPCWLVCLVHKVSVQ